MCFKTRLDDLSLHSCTCSHVRNPLSSAQMCPEDILRIIYSQTGTSRADCARGARVCRAWNGACIAELYRTLIHSEIHVRSCPDDKWIHHLDNSRTLRAHVRSMIIDMKPQPPSVSISSILSPLAHIFTPELTRSATPSYLQINGFWHIGQVSQVIAKSGIIRGTSHLDLRYDDLPEPPKDDSLSNFEAALHVILPAAPLIVSFSARLVTSAPNSISSHANPSPLPSIPLCRLSLSIGALGHKVLPLLIAVTDTLQQLHLRIEEKEVNDVQRNACVTAISKMHGLIELMIEPRAGALGGPPRLPPLLDEIVPHLPNLRYLFCGRGTFSPALMHHLPTTLEGLYLVAPLPSHVRYGPLALPSATDVLYDMMRQLLASDQTRLKSLYWWIDGVWGGDPGPAVRELKAMAQEVGVDFQSDSDYYALVGMRTKKWSTDLLQPSFSLKSIMTPKSRE